MSAALHQIVIIFAAIATGFICRKARIIDEKGTGVLSNIVIKVILPFYLFNAIACSKANVSADGVFAAIGLSTAMFILSGMIAYAFAVITKAPGNDRGVYMFELLCGNVTYIGIPVCTAILGEEAAFYASLLNIPFNLLCFSLGIFLLCGKFSAKRILNPAFLSGVLGCIVFVSGIKIPAVVSDACSFIGQATSPIAMLVIGSVLGSADIKEIFGEWRMIPYVVIRLFGIAGLVFLLTRSMNIEPTLRGVLALMAAMPAATNSTMLCTIYGGNRELSAKLIFLSTALSIVSIPLWAMVFN